MAGQAGGAEVRAGVLGVAPPPAPVPGLAGAVGQLHGATATAERLGDFVLAPLLRFAAVIPRLRAEIRSLHPFQAGVDALLQAAAAKADADPAAAAETVFGRLQTAARGDAALLRREAGLLFFAGVDTSSHTIAYTLALLAAHPAAGARLAAELGAAGLLARPGRPVPRALEPSDASRLPYLQACIKESMRLLPVAGAGTARLVGRGGARVGGGYVPPGTELWVPLYVLHRSPALWGPTAAEFVPDRWLQAGAAGPEAARRFLPFSAGARSCLGQALAEVNVATALAVLWGRFEFAFPPAGGAKAAAGGPSGPLPASLAELEATLALTVTLQPRQGVWLVARDRAGGCGECEE